MLLNGIGRRRWILSRPTDVAKDLVEGAELLRIVSSAQRSASFWLRRRRRHCSSGLLDGGRRLWLSLRWSCTGLARQSNWSQILLG